MEALAATWRSLQGGPAVSGRLEPIVGCFSPAEVHTSLEMVSGVRSVCTLLLKELERTLAHPPEALAPPPQASTALEQKNRVIAELTLRLDQVDRPAALVPTEPVSATPAAQQQRRHARALAASNSGTQALAAAERAARERVAELEVALEEREATVAEVRAAPPQPDVRTPHDPSRSFCALKLRSLLLLRCSWRRCWPPWRPARRR
jgi:uncharacterized protein YhaN